MLYFEIKKTQFKSNSSLYYSNPFLFRNTKFHITPCNKIDPEQITAAICGHIREAKELRHSRTKQLFVMHVHFIPKQIRRLCVFVSPFTLHSIAMSALFRPLRLVQRFNTTPTGTQRFSIVCQSQPPTVRPNISVPRPVQRRTVVTLRTARKWYQSLWQPRSNVVAPYAHITQIGDPMLRQPAQPVPAEAIGSREVQFLVDRMVAVMRDYGCVGLAAPQIGTPLQVLVMEFTSEQLASFSGDVQRAKRMAVMPLTVGFVRQIC